jgi:putative peptidoglycan lipid II flippase
MSQMLKSSGAMSAATLTSRVLGLVREIVYARFMGTSPVAGAFQMAFTVPNLFRRLLGEGALTAAFIPIFKEKEKAAGEVEMWRVANAVISGLIVVSAIIVAAVVFGVSLALAVGDFSGNTRLMLELLRVMFPYMLLVCVAAAGMGMLNARGHFFVPALSAAVLNVAMIASVLFLAPHMGKTTETQIFGLALGVLFAGVAQAAFQWPTLHREGYRYAWVSPWRNEAVREVVRKMLPASIGVAAFQINVMLTQALAFGVHAPIVATFNYAVRLMEFPQGVFGISLATYLLPTLSGLAAEKKYPEFRATLRQGLSLLMFVNLLASVLLVALAEPIVRLLFERGKFDVGSTSSVAGALFCLAPGLVAFSTVNILARAFYALGDTGTPMRISIVCLAINLVLAYVLLEPYHAAGLGLANTTTSLLNLSLLFYALRRKLARLELGELVRSLPALLGAAVLAGMIGWVTWNRWEHYLGHSNLGLKIGAVVLPVGAASLLYLGVTNWLGIGFARQILGLIIEKLRPPWK